MMEIKPLVMKIVADLSSLGGLPFYIFFMIFFIFENQILSFKLLYMLIIGMIIGALSKIFYTKSRPAKDDKKAINEKSQRMIGGILSRIDNSAFPSIHTMRITMFSLLMINVFHNPFSTLFFIILIISVGASRMLLKLHDIGDVFGGVFFGVVSYFIMMFISAV